MKRYPKLLSYSVGVLLLLAICAPTHGQVTYVDVTDGPAGNTMHFLDGSWQAWTAFVGQTWTPGDGIWDRRTEGNAGVFQNAASGQVDLNAARLRTTIIAPELPGPGWFYNVHVLFWSDVSSWRVGASLTDDVGQLPLHTRYNSTQLFIGADGTVLSDTLSPNPFTTAVMVGQGNRRLFMTPALGRVYGSTITVFMESARNQLDSNQRTWVDGVAFQAIPEPTTAGVVILGFVGLLVACRRRFLRK